MKKCIVLLTSEFPWGNGEPFLETELGYYKNVSIMVVPLKVKKGSKKRGLPPNASALKNVEKSFFEKAFQGLLCIFNKECIGELVFLFRAKRLNGKAVRKVLTNAFYGHMVSRRVERLLDGKKIDPQNVIFYSYWMDAGAYAAILLKRKYKGSKAVSRCHRFDLYEERHPSGCVPFRRQLKELDAIFPISRDGEAYLEGRYGFLRKEKIRLFCLGIDNGFLPEYQRNGKFRIITCSRLVSVKRVDKIVLALSLLEKEEIQWLHIGMGEEHKNVSKLAKRLLKHNISYKFAGQLSNKEVMEQYRSNCYDLFINASSTEGIPVSIMEAFSFGIPAIATEVGGNGEIVVDGKNGRLLGKDFEPEQLADLIREFYYMDRESYLRYRESAHKSWEEKYNGAKNYREFVDYLLRL